MSNLGQRVKTSKPLEAGDAVVEIWDEGGSLIGVIEPNKQKPPQGLPSGATNTTSQNSSQ